MPVSKFFILEGKTSSFIPVPEKAFQSTFVTFSGIVISLIFLQLSKVTALISVIPLGRLTFSKFTQPEKEALPHEVTLSGIVTSFNFSHL